MMEFLSNALNNDKGFFQGGKSFGGKGLDGLFKDLKNKSQDKPFAGQPGVCPYTGKPLQSKTEQETGVSDEARSSGIQPETVGQNAITNREIIATPEGLQNPYVKAQLDQKNNLINQLGGLSQLSGMGALQGMNVQKMRNMGGYYL